MEAIKEISVVFNFWYNEVHLEMGLAPIIFSDKVVPGDISRNFEKIYPNYAFVEIDSSLRSKLDIMLSGVT